MGTQEAPLLLLQSGAKRGHQILMNPMSPSFPSGIAVISGIGVIKGQIRPFFLGGVGGSPGFIQSCPPASQENRCSAAVNGINNTQIRAGSGTLPP